MVRQVSGLSRPGGDVPTISLLGFPIADLGLDEVADRLLNQCLAGDHLYITFTPNTEMMERALRCERFAHLLRAADLLVPDGVGLIWASRVLGDPLKGVVPGVDLLDRLLVRAGGERLPVFFLGTRPGIVEEAARRARERYPGLQVVGCQHGYFPREQEPEIVSAIRRAQPHLLVTGMGVPRDQEFVCSHGDELPPGVALCVGGGLDVLAGTARRAPSFWRQAGLEWLYRLCTDPRRWRRQLALPRFCGQVLLRRLRG